MILYAATAFVVLMFIGVNAVAYGLSHRLGILLCGFLGFAAFVAVYGVIVAGAQGHLGSDLFQESMIAAFGLSASLETATKISLLVLVGALFRRRMGNAAVVSLGLSYAACEILHRDAYAVLGSFNELLGVFGIALFGDAFMAPFRDTVAAVAEADPWQATENAALLAIQSMAIVVMHVSIFVILFRLMRTVRLATTLLVAVVIAVLHAGSDLLTQAAGHLYPFVGPTIVWIGLAAAWGTVAYVGRLRPPSAERREVPIRSGYS